jgi:RNA polymerase sigma factor (sigma-70 family)
MDAMLRVSSLIAQFKSGSESAFAGLVAAYFPQQVRIAHNQLRCLPVGAADADDVAVSVFVNLWREVNAGRKLRQRLTDRASLVRTLGMLIRQKVNRLSRDAGRRKDGSRRTIRACELAASAWNCLPDAAPGPTRCAESREVFERALSRLEPRTRRIVAWRLAGHDKLEIAGFVGVSERTVERELSLAVSVLIEEPMGEDICSS